MRRRDFPLVIAGAGLSCTRPAKSVRAAENPSARKLALLIGINRYRSGQIPQLSGCVNDIKGMYSVLIGSYGFSKKDILMLLDDKATYVGIIDAFRQHLLKQVLSPNDVVVFQYSGHGSRQPSTSSASGKGETIVPYDSRDPRNLDITSEALSSMFSELANQTKNITVILDSCNSGRMIATVRGINDNVAVREIGPPQDPPPAPPFAAPSRRDLVPDQSGFQPLDDSYVLLASVLASQLASEYRSGGKSYGAMTYFLMRELSGPPAKATYRNVMDIVRLRVMEAVADETPQAVGPNVDHYLFGIDSPPAIPYTLMQRDGTVIRLPYSGAAHGIAEGTRYDVYANPPRASTTPAASIEVMRVNPFDSEAKAISGSVPEIGYAVMRERGIKIGTLAVWIDTSPKLNQARTKIGDAPEFQVVADRTAANLQVVSEGEGMGIYTPDGLAMFDPAAPIGDSAALLGELRRWTNWFAMLGLENVSSDIRIKLRLEPVADRGVPPIRLPQLGKPEMILKAGSVYEPVVNNDTDVSLYMTLLGLSSDRSISVIFPVKANAEAAFEVKAHSERRLPRIRADIPCGFKVSRDVVILFASTQQVGFSSYIQGGFCGRTRNFSDASIGTRGWVSPPGTWASTRHIVEIQP
jgi:hypothetical protein